MPRDRKENPDTAVQAVMDDSEYTEWELFEIERLWDEGQREICENEKEKCEDDEHQDENVE